MDPEPEEEFYSVGEDALFLILNTIDWDDYKTFDGVVDLYADHIKQIKNPKIDKLISIRDFIKSVLAPTKTETDNETDKEIDEIIDNINQIISDIPEPATVSRSDSNIYKDIRSKTEKGQARRQGMIEKRTNLTPRPVTEPGQYIVYAGYDDYDDNPVLTNRGMKTGMVKMSELPPNIKLSLAAGQAKRRDVVNYLKEKGIYQTGIPSSLVEKERMYPPHYLDYDGDEVNIHAPQ